MGMRTTLNTTASSSSFSESALRPAAISGVLAPPKWQKTTSTWVDLTKEPEIRDAGLKLVGLDELVPSDKLFMLDLSNGGYGLEDFNTMHVSFPSTLLRRPRTGFRQLLSTLHVQTQSQLREALGSAEEVVLYDDCSTMNHCLQQTYMVLLKLLPFLKETKASFSIGLLEAGVSSLSKNEYPKMTNTSCPSFKITHHGAKCKETKHPSLTLHIPDTAGEQISPNAISSATSTRMFIQSIKRDVVHYSPNSLKKYFLFHTPLKLPKHVPTWLLPYNTTEEDVLTKILDSFELLEDMEVKRLEKCLMSASPNSNLNISPDYCNGSKDTTTCDNVQKKSSHDRPYSLRQLQKQFKPNRNAYDSDDDNFCVKSSRVALDNKLRMDIKEELSDSNKKNLIGKLNSVSPSLTQTLSMVNGNSKRSFFNKEQQQSDQEVDTEQEDIVVETPMSSYQMTNGIQSFTKNRYSNILPYEHSRVKLQPSPIFSEEDSNCTLPKVHLSPELNNSLDGDAHDSQQLSLSRDGTNKHNVCSDDDNTSYFSQNMSPSKRACTETVNLDKVTPDVLLQVNKEPFNDYFNANYLRLPQINPSFNYIATQAPLPATIDDFWNVVISNNLKVIISLNSYDELDLKKWDIYWNSKTIKKHSVEVVATYEDVLGISGCILRVMEVNKIDSDSTNSPDHKHYHPNTPKNSVHTVYQLHYTKWLDSCGIDMKDFMQLHYLKNYLSRNADALMNFLNTNEGHDVTLKDFNLPRENMNAIALGSPILVHCSAGCGRTGVFITLDFLLSVLDPHAYQSNKIDVWNMSSDLIFIVVNELRKQRISMVQNMTQYLTCYESMLEYFYLKENI